MFLFTTPPSRETQAAANPVVSAIREGAERTGTGFDYLLKTAQRESALAPDAKAKSSSATGLFQFIEQTWLSMVKQEGPKQGLQNYADAISENGGRLTVSDPALREKILQLRNDPQVAAVMAGALTQKNRDQLSGALGRQPQAGELYMAHVLGARGAADLIKAAASDPSRVAARDFPDAAAANRGIFYDKAGRARSVQEVYGVLAASHASTQIAATTASGSAAGDDSMPVTEIAAALQPGRAHGLIGLFSTGGSREPVSKAVSNLWTSPRANGTRTASLDGAERYFPRIKSDASTAGEGAAARPSEGQGAAVAAPLPPQRPADLGPPQAGAAQAGKPRRGPLNLSSFMLQGGDA
ncbi:lytic transglycosylase domain-containing protein [Bosea sp. (in: a-proteobacteria)]|uniref:lytic transglycosylase domain-containing protein n=1 Tax=Bosea sp. (in: a-proteobacteria) TaxID=1871050 RepID=UPI001AD4C4A8|nr:lytic transglycosylase domain-containing protein [Bosea sp. (in: a-proteobacteria)]MBN9443467.1 lytic transglycosylase domain-containing protein [Bosea sp. (in: a-proteobacteria)]